MSSPLIENDPWFTEAKTTYRQTQQIGPLVWTEGTFGPRLGWGMQDDFNSMVYYGSFGLLDPKMPFEAFGIRSALGLTGLSGLAIGAGISMTGGVAIAAAVGWAVDPMDMREGGMAEWDWEGYAGRRKFG